MSTLESLEEELQEILVHGFTIQKDKKGKIVIFTGLKEGLDGELTFLDEEDQDEDLDLDEDEEFSSDIDE